MFWVFKVISNPAYMWNALNVKLCNSSTNGILIDFNFRILILVQSSSIGLVSKV